MIKLEQVSFSYPNRPVLEDFSLELPKAGVVALTGPSGCGKTTVLHLLSGLLQPQKGRVLTVPAAVVFQEDRLLPWMTARQNIAVVLQTPHAAQEAAFWLEAVGLNDVKDSYPAALSGGMRRRVAIARALAKGGDLLLLDEPFTGLDADSRKNCVLLVKERFSNASVLLVTHQPEEAEQMNAMVCKLSSLVK